MSSADEAPAATEDYDIDRRLFGRHLRSLRKTRALTQEALAERADLSTDTIRRLEAGLFSPSMVTMVKLSKGLQLRYSTILTSCSPPLTSSNKNTTKLSSSVNDTTSSTLSANSV